MKAMEPENPDISKFIFFGNKWQLIIALNKVSLYIKYLYCSEK